MSLKIIDKKENPLLSRIEVSAEVSFEKATPSENDVKKQIASELKADEKLVVVKNIYTGFGLSNAKVTAFVYNSKEEMEKVETKPKVKEGAKPAGEKPAEKPAEAPKSEEKKEEVKEAKPETTPAASEKPEEKAGKE